VSQKEIELEGKLVRLCDKSLDVF